MTILGLWLAYAALATPVFAGLFIWALRMGQFSDQDRARSLALDEDTAPSAAYSARRPGPALYACLALTGSVVLMICLALLVRLTSPSGGPP